MLARLTKEPRILDLKFHKVHYVESVERLLALVYITTSIIQAVQPIRLFVRVPLHSVPVYRAFSSFSLKKVTDDPVIRIGAPCTEIKFRREQTIIIYPFPDCWFVIGRLFCPLRFVVRRGNLLGFHTIFGWNTFHRIIFDCNVWQLAFKENVRA